MRKVQKKQAEEFTVWVNPVFDVWGNDKYQKQEKG